MDYNQVGRSGLKVSSLAFGAGTFGGQGPLFSAWGNSDAKDAARLVDICLDAGVTLFDTADVYSNGASEEILGQALKGKRDRALLSTKIGLPMGDGPGEAGTSRQRIKSTVEAALKRLQTDHIDLLQLHAFDSQTPIEEVMATLDQLVREGKVGYTGVSNFSGWQVMKSLAVADRYGWNRHVANQSYYSLVGRDYEWELMPLGAEEGLGAIVWSPLGWGRLTGKVSRNRPIPVNSRLHETAQWGPPVSDDLLFDVIDVLQEIASETGKSVPQIAINWILQRPTVSSVIMGARNEEQLRDNLGAVGWSLSPEHMARLDAASAGPIAYPYYPYRTQDGFARLSPPLV